MKSAPKKIKSAKDEKRLAEVGRLTRSIGHEFTNILQILTTSLEIAKERVKAGNQSATQVLLDEMVETVTLGSKICQDLMTLARESSLPEAKPKVQLISLKQAVEKTIRLLTHEIKTRRLQISQTISEHGRVRFYEPHLLQVLLNLIKNSIEASQKQGRIEITASEDQRGYWLEIKDFGTGISTGNMNQLFTPYFTTKGKSGNGLGLVTCQNILSSYGGEIQITSQEGKGTQVKLRFPKAQA